MRIVDQGHRRESLGTRASLDDGGFIMVVLLISIAVGSIWMTAMLPAWRQQVIREKEAELIFRGEQYARAIYLFRQKNNQASPPSIDILVSQRYLRKKYLDPITGEEFLPVGAQSLQGTQQAGGAIQVGLTGVRSKSNDTSIVVYLGQQTYSQFPFDYQYEAQRSGTGGILPGGVGPGEGRGRGGRGAPAGRGGSRGIGNPAPAGRGGFGQVPGRGNPFGDAPARGNPFGAGQGGPAQGGAGRGGR